jgi:hypothetical protein
MSSISKGVFFTLLATIITFFAQAQTQVKGTVKDNLTNTPLANISVYFADGNGTLTDSAGNFTLSSNRNFRQLVFSGINYKKKTVIIKPGQQQQVDAALETNASNLQDITVTSKKKIKYTNKNNPAVELIRKVIEHRDSNRISSYQTVSYEQYEKMQCALSSADGSLPGRKLFKKFDFLLDNIDTNSIANKTLLPFYVEETVSKKYARNDPEREKTVILGSKKVNFGEAIDAGGVSKYLKFLYQDIDVYQNNVTLFTNQLLSPIANVAPTFYMFFIKDTVADEHGTKLVRLQFYPRNTHDMLFKGTIFITLDGNYAVQKLSMTINPNINLNWVKELHIAQDFSRNIEGRYYVTSTNIKADFGLTQNSKRGIYGERTIAIKDMVVNEPIPNTVFAATKEEKANEENEYQQQDSFWQYHRQVPLSVTEAKTYSNIDSLHNMKSYKRLMDWATILLAGYKVLGPYEVGPINTFYSFSPVEGLRLRFGGRTTPQFSRRIYLENYVAYGFKDDRVKYFLSTAYSINNKSIYKFPYNYIKASFTHDIKIPGQELQFVAEDNFLLSFKRGTNDKWVYNDVAKLEYVKEFKNNFSYNLGFKYMRQKAAGTISFTEVQYGKTRPVQDLTTSEVSLELRWAPHEAYYQGKVYRTPIINQYPIFTLKGTAGIKGLFDGQYNYQKISLNIFKRFYLSQLGYTDVVAEGGLTFGKVPFPLLTIHRANQTFAYQLYSYNLMNFMEFVSDRYASINLDHHFNGLLFNRVPLLKKLKWREIVSAKVLYGGVRAENDPSKSDGVYQFPQNAEGTPITYSLNKQPYVEGSVGIGNIFKLLRLDYVRRFTYLENPDVAKWGIRARLRFDF